jgi:wyosine [tRNA(Phe)-imidazoG37] synthetase (radical SAM superfamily)
MIDNHDLLSFGPVPSRRLGQSLGINNIPPKICTYSCVYCQLGKSLNMKVGRGVFYKPEDMLKSIEKRIKDAKNRKERIDYLTFVPDGEPTLDINLGQGIELFKQLGIKIAVISNASLIWHKDVQDDLCKADWVSLKIDTVDEGIWHKIDRPYRSLRLDKILAGVLEFSHAFNGILATETMLIQGVNDSIKDAEEVADFIAGLKNVKSYLSIPTRPPAEKHVKPADEHAINSAYQVFKDKSIDVEYLIGYEGNAFAFTGDVEGDLLSITSVHPMRKEAVDEFLKKANGNWGVITKLTAENKLVETKYKGNLFYMRKI